MFRQNCFLLISLIVLSLSCTNNRNNVEQINDDTFKVDEDNEKIKLAVKDAQQNINIFIESLQQHSNDSNYHFLIKSSFDGGTVIEHLWIEPLEYKNNFFTGILFDEPYKAVQFKAGDTIKVNKKNVEDWSISNEDKNIAEGFFTERYLFGTD